MGSGVPPFVNGREVPQARNRSGDTPSSFKQFCATKIIYNFTNDYATPNYLGSGETPSDHWSGAMSSPWAVTGAPSLTSEFYIIDRGVPSWSRAQLAPDPATMVGHPNFLATNTSRYFAIIFIVDAILQDIAKKQTYFAIQHKSIPETTWALEIPLPSPGAGLRPVRELAEEPRASLNNSYNLFLLSHATGANILKQLTIKHHTL